MKGPTRDTNKAGVDKGDRAQTALDFLALMEPKDKCESVRDEFERLERANKMTEEEGKILVARLMDDYKDVFKGDIVGMKVRPVDIAFKPEHEGKVINMADSARSPRDLAILKKDRVERMEMGLVEPSTSPWNIRQVIVDKPPVTGEEEFRVCGNYIPVNHMTEREGYALPKTDEVLRRIAGTGVDNLLFMWWSHLDLRKAFNQLRLTARSRRICAFTEGGRKWQEKVVPYGLNSATELFQQRMVE